MKIWRFYKVPEKDIKNKSYDLYAITNNKDKAKRFQAERNMKRFIKRVSNEDDDMYAKLANDNLDCVLDDFMMETRDIYPNGLIGHKSVSVLCTNYEVQVAKEEGETASEITLEEFWSHVLNYNAYKKKIRDALRVLEYVKYYKLYTLPFDTYIDPADDDYAAPSISIDEVVALIRVFGDTFK